MLLQRLLRRTPERLILRSAFAQSATDNKIVEAKTYIQHGINLTRTGKRDLAVLRFRKAIQAINSVGFRAGTDTGLIRAAASSNLATTLREKFRETGSMDHATESATLFNGAVKDLEGAVGPDHIRVAKVLRDFAELLEMVDDSEGVEAALRRALTIHSKWGIVNKEQDVGISACERTMMMLPLAAACKSQGKMDEVEELEEPFYKCVEVALNSDANNLAGALDSMEKFMALTGKDRSEIEFAINLLKSLKKEKKAKDETSAE